MSWRDDLQKGASSAVLSVCKSIGVPVLFKHRNNAPITIYVMPVPAPVLSSGSGSLNEDRLYIFEITTQPGFVVPNGTDDVEPVTIGDLITFMSRTCVIKDWDSDTISAAYRVTTVEHKRLSTGI